MQIFNPYQEPSESLVDDQGHPRYVPYFNYAELVDVFMRKLVELSREAITAHAEGPDLSDDVVGIINLSDWHLGKKVVLNDKITFNIGIAQERIRLIRNRLLDSIKRWDLKKVIVAVNGDMVEGGGVNFLHQPYNIDAVVDDQMVIASLELWDIIEALSGAVEKVVVIAVSGNHGRAKIPDPTANFDLFVYRYVYNILHVRQNEGEFKNVSMFISTENFINYKVNEHLRVHVRHMTRAKQIKTAAGRARFLAICGTHNVDAVLSGHWHNPTFEMSQDKWNIINGSLVGMDTYAEELNLRSDYSQVFNVFDKNKMAGIEILY